MDFEVMIKVWLQLLAYWKANWWKTWKMCDSVLWRYMDVNILNLVSLLISIQYELYQRWFQTFYILLHFLIAEVQDFPLI